MWCHKSIEMHESKVKLIKKGAVIYSQPKCLILEINVNRLC